MTKPTDPRIERSQKALLSAGLELLNINREATLSDIATHAGVGRSTLYRQYKDREELIKAVALYCFDQIDEATADIEPQANSALDGIRLVIQQVIPLAQEFQFLTNLNNFIVDDIDIDARHTQNHQEMLQLVEQAKQEKNIDPSLPSVWIVNVIDGLIFAAWTQQQNTETSHEEAATLAYRCFEKAVKP